MKILKWSYVDRTAEGKPVKILKWWTRTVVFQCKSKSFKKTVEKAVKKGISLAGTDFYIADLSKATLQNGDFFKANFAYADLRGADLRGADLRGAILFNANLKNADLRGANLKNANLAGVSLEDVVI